MVWQPAAEAERMIERRVALVLASSCNCLVA